MDEQFFDDLAKGLNDGSVSRAWALKLVGAALLAAMLPPLFPRPAVASARKKCKKKGGIFLSTGTCHCGYTCNATDITLFVCHSNPNCDCFETVSGKGFCATTTSGGQAFGCSTNAECPTGTTCVVEPSCAGSGGSCTSSTDCPGNYGCVKGTCQFSFCIGPCPT